MSLRQCPSETAGEGYCLLMYPISLKGYAGPFLQIDRYGGVHTSPSLRPHHLGMRFKLPRIGKQKTLTRSRPATSGDQPPGRKYYLGATILRFPDCFWPVGTAAVFDRTWHISTHDDTAMSAIQTALAVLMEGSSFATKLPFITPIASLILQALTMRDARVRQISYDSSVF